MLVARQSRFKYNQSPTELPQHINVEEGESYLSLAQENLNQEQATRLLLETKREKTKQLK